MNSVQLIGRLVRDPDVRYTAGSQMAVASFTIAIDRPTRAGEEKKADFPRITVFGRQAETCEKYLAKGRKVAIEGRIQTGSYQNKNGDTVYTTDVIANRVEFLDWGDRQQGGGGFQQGADRAPAPQAPQAPQSPAEDRPDSFQAIEEDVPF
ncbi:single-stranded DNA-binding protein [Eubacterium sp. AB3007]|jgi:single-strand DNA-binding protein|uniref:single-stranded DNA-binding protein n=1 Tax=Eubacterium sp. AB3007 TaxID=1392487 RepID=UPI0004821082|nr:single-stranded DNA-binding protein [Eubacterium sp. AB3007]